MTASRRALIVRGGWPGHHPVETTEMFIPFLETHGHTVRVEESPEVYADAVAMADVDLIVQAVSMGEISEPALRGLRAAVSEGTGLAGWHGGIVDSYRAHTGYLQLVGGQFVEHPAKAQRERRGDGTDGFVTHTIDITELGREHPITRGIDDFELTTEQYWVLHDDLSDVLATTTHPARPDQPWHRPLTSPAVWTREWGEGRVFVATPGHEPAVLRDPNVRTIVERGLLWASRSRGH
ncbi:ThuA domain-containing protein [Microbacterium sp. 3J1]|uniref:ThuA domain-containing protein n=1 Tax=Microbacterium sp. 3J1 TaxID=861269 RepID=UPI000ACD338F|nr:ThuA domain-containing protein [Microbacterium sp. 3J1]